MLGKVRADRLADPPLVERHPSLVHHRPERLRKARLAEHLARLVGPAGAKVRARGVGVGGEPVDRLKISLVIEYRHGDAAVRELDRRLEHLRARQPAELVVQPGPPGDDPRHHGRHRSQVLGLGREELRPGGARAASHEVQRPRLARRQGEHGDADPAETGEVGLGHRDGGGRGHSRVDGGPSGGEHLDPRLGGERVGRGHHAAAAQRHRPDPELRRASRVRHRAPPAHEDPRATILRVSTPLAEFLWARPVSRGSAQRCNRTFARRN